MDDGERSDVDPEETRQPGRDDPGERTVVPGQELGPVRAEASTDLGAATRPPGGPRGAARPLLGVVAAYTATAGDPTDPPSQAGRVYALHAGDVLFVGKEEPSELPLRDGGVLRITHAHLLTRLPENNHVSREHLALEMLDGGRFRIYDYSLNGVFLEKAARYLRRGNLRPEVHEITGRETIVLGIDVAQGDRSARQAASRTRLEVVPIAADPSLDVGRGSLRSTPEGEVV